MLKTKSVLEVKIKERTYSLELDPMSPLGEVYDAVSMIRGYVIERIIEEDEASKKKTEENTTEEN